MTMWDSALAVQVDADGLRWTFGPIEGLPAAMRFVSEHLWDTNRYRHEYIELIAAADAEKWLNTDHRRDQDAGLFNPPGREHREPLEAALRAAIQREHGEPGEGPHGDGLYAHLDVHRPWRLTLKSEECWEGSCDHPETVDGACSAPSRRVLWCRSCTPTYVGGGEWDGQPYAECQVDWPCSPVLAMCAAFSVPLTGKALG